MQVSIPLWALVHLPVVVTVTTAVFTPKGWLHCILYVLFENAMGIVKMGAVVAGESLLHSTALCNTLHASHVCDAPCIACVSCLVIDRPVTAYIHMEDCC